MVDSHHHPPYIKCATPSNLFLFPILGIIQSLFWSYGESGAYPKKNNMLDDYVLYVKELKCSKSSQLLLLLLYSGVLCKVHNRWKRDVCFHKKFTIQHPIFILLSKSPCLWQWIIHVQIFIETPIILKKCFVWFIYFSVVQAESC